MNWFQKASVWLSEFTGLTEGGRQDRDNFVTNRVTLQDHDDSGASSSHMALSAVWACSGLVAGTIASLPLVVMRKVGDHKVLATEHDLFYKLHDSPNADQTALDFWEYQALALELRGDAFAEKELGAGGRLIALHPINPEAMTVRRLGNGEIGYRWNENGRARSETREKVLHVPGFGGNPLGGMSTLAYARKTFNLSASLNSSASTLFHQGIMGSGYIKTELPLNAEQRIAAETLIQEKWTGARNAHRPMLFDKNMSWQAITINPDDAQMLESRSFSIEEICRYFNVPPHMIGHTEKASSWGTGIEQMTLGFVKYTLRRRLKRIEKALEKQLLTSEDRLNGISIEFNIEGLLRGDSKNRSEFYGAALDKSWMTINEVRALEGLPPKEGGDVLRSQMQYVPITETAVTPPAAAA